MKPKLPTKAEWTEAGFSVPKELCSPSLAEEYVSLRDHADQTEVLATFTPGPWKTGRGGDLTLRIYGRGKGTAENVICQFGDGIDETREEYANAEANARIMVASLDMLKALKALLVAIECGGHEEAIHRSNPLSVLAARAAIAKATRG